jgi:hypothetical protein
MKLVKTEDARVGQRAARDVIDLRGNLLFKAGTELTAEALETCKQRTIAHLFIEEGGVSSQQNPLELETRKVNLTKELDRLFTGTDKSPTMVALREASKRWLLGKLPK